MLFLIEHQIGGTILIEKHSLFRFYRCFIFVGSHLIKISKNLLRLFIWMQISKFPLLLFDTTVFMPSSWSFLDQYMYLGNTYTKTDNNIFDAKYHWMLSNYRNGQPQLKYYAGAEELDVHGVQHHTLFVKAKDLSGRLWICFINCTPIF